MCTDNKHDNGDASLIDGKKFAKFLLDYCAYKVAQELQKPALAVVLVGEDPASSVYVRNKIIQAKKIGIKSIEYKLHTETSQEVLLDLIEQLNNDDNVDGILVQLPLPKQIDVAKVLLAILPQKDVDGFHPYNVGLLQTTGEGIAPCTPLGAIMLLIAHNEIAGKHAVIIGRSNIVGKPIAQLLLQHNATVSIVHSYSKNVDAICRQADIVVAAVGKPGLVQASWIKPGAIVLDIGISGVQQDGKRILKGDVNFFRVSKVAGYISPVPGGVGPMTVACLMHNTLLLYYRRRQNKQIKGYCLTEFLLQPNWWRSCVDSNYT